MKTIKILLAILVVVAASKIGLLLADQGWELASRIERGRTETPNQITVANTATQIVGASIVRPDVTCFNNTARTLWIAGDNTVTVGNGFPVLSSATFRDDAYIGTIYGICDSGNCDVRCWVGLVPGP